jgi:hypothetical protein
MENKNQKTDIVPSVMEAAFHTPDRVGCGPLLPLCPVSWV